jgi:hypothetical protein
LRMPVITGVETLLSAANAIPSMSGDIHSLLRDTINGVVEEVLGKEAAKAMYDQLEREFYIDRNKIPEHLEDFFMLLERIYGLKSDMIERLIAKKLWANLVQPKG